MKIKQGLKIRYNYPKPFDSNHAYDDGIITNLSENTIRIKLTSIDGILLIPRTKQNIKQMKVLK